MKKRNICSLIIMIAILLLGNIIFAETAFTWDGYGLYNLNNSNVTFVGENSNIILSEDQLDITSEYIIKNNATSDTKLVVGLPYENFDNLTISDKGTNVKLTTIMRKTITKAFGAQENIPQLNKWKNASIYLVAGETRAITLKYAKTFKNDIGGDVAINYLSDRKGNIASEIGYADVSIQVGECEPYNIVANGAKSLNGQFIWHIEQANMSKISLIYKNTWETFLNTIKQSKYPEMSDLEKLYENKEYSQVIEKANVMLADPKYVTLKQDINILLLETYKDSSDSSNYDKLYKSIDVHGIMNKDLASKIAYDRIKLLKLASDFENIVLEGEALVNDSTLNEGVKLIIQDSIDEAKVTLNVETDKKDEEKPVKQEKEPFKFKFPKFKLPSLKAINDSIGQFFKDSIKFVKEYTWIVSLVVILIILVIIYIKRKRRSSRTIRFK